MHAQTKRVYDEISEDDGVRILVDRLWPRGMTKERLQAVWMKEIAPSNELRTWFKKKGGDWDEFKLRYIRELDNNPGAVSKLRAAARSSRVTLLYSSKDRERNHAAVLIEYLADS